MLDIAQSSVITWQTLKHVGGGGNLTITTTGERCKDKQKLVLGPLCLHTESSCRWKEEERLLGDEWTGK